jgi:hypothetical protein
MAYSCVSGPAWSWAWIGNRAWGDLLSAHRTQAMNDPWTWGLAFLLGVIVGHYFSTVCPW